MSLNYDLSALPEDVAFKGDGIHPITDAIIWYCMGVGIPELTAKTLPEFYARMRLNDLLFGGTLLKTSSGKPYHITVADLRKRIGIKTDITNIGLSCRGGETRAKWMRRVVGQTLDQWKREAKA